MYEKIATNERPIFVYDRNRLIPTLEEMIAEMPKIKETLAAESSAKIEKQRKEREEMTRAILASSAINDFNRKNREKAVELILKEQEDKVKVVKHIYGFLTTKKRLAGIVSEYQGYINKASDAVYVKYNEETKEFNYPKDSIIDSNFCTFVKINFKIDWVSLKVYINELQTSEEDLKALVKKIKCSCNNEIPSDFVYCDFKFHYGLKEVMIYDWLK